MSAKAIVLRPIAAREANAAISRWHYSGSTCIKSQLHFGVFWNGRMEGAISLGPSMDKRKVRGLVSETPWNAFIEINRMAFSDALPRNAESRALSVMLRLLRKHAPHLQWVLSYADGTQCGDGTIYRAAGFVLTGITPNKTIWEGPTGARFVDISLRALARRKAMGSLAGKTGKYSSDDIASIPAAAANSMPAARKAGFLPVRGHQLRYVYFLDPSCRDRLTVPILPFSEIDLRGAGMYRGQPRAGSVDGDTSASHVEEGGSIPTPALHEAAD